LKNTAGGKRRAAPFEALHFTRYHAGATHAPNSLDGEKREQYLGKAIIIIIITVHPLVSGPHASSLLKIFKGWL